MDDAPCEEYVTFVGCCPLEAEVFLEAGVCCCVLALYRLPLLMEDTCKYVVLFGSDWGTFVYCRMTCI